jgi:hypothetical protein
MIPMTTTNSPAPVAKDSDYNSADGSSDSSDSDISNETPNLPKAMP